MDSGDLWATMHGVAKSDTTKMTEHALSMHVWLSVGNGGCGRRMVEQ